ncbi:MAG: RNA polymerase sigma factor [Myxococcota bacterium]
MSETSIEDRDPAEESSRDRSGSDAEVVRRAAAGDVEAFETLYRTHVPRIHGLCLRMARDRNEADELTQQTFVRAWERLGSFRGDAAFSTWLHRVAVNVVISEMRARGRWRERHTDEVPTDLVSLPTGALEGTDLDLERAIAGLSTQARLVFWLHDVLGYKHQEIADTTGLAVGTSKAHLHRARRLLREELS